MTDMTVPAFFEAGVLVLVGATLIHLLFVGLFGYLPRFVGWFLIAGYGVFLYRGLFS